jgi:lysine 6-dehydrogenase
MKIAVLGAGLMGPTIAMDCIKSDEVEEVLLIDINEEKLNKAATKLGNPPKLKTLKRNITDRHKLVESLRGYDVVGIALPRWLNTKAIWGTIEAGINAVDLSEPAQKDWTEINKAAKKAAVTIIPGCGLEPGLTDMLAAHGIDMLDTTETVNIWCGGIPQNPKPPLDYKILFGGPYLPLRPGMVKIIKDGKVQEVKRYTLGEPIHFQEINQTLECFYDRFPETLHQLEKFKHVKHCTNKTVRYPGYCDKVKFLDECGLLSRKPIEFKNQKIVPFEVFSKIIHPKVRLEEDEKDITVLRVTIKGVKNNRETCYTFNMIDFYDDDQGVTSMAKTTSYTAAIAIRMLGRGDIQEKGLVPPVKAIRGNLFRRLLKELAERGIQVTETGTTQSSL